MKIKNVALYQPGNIFTRRLAIELTLDDAAGTVLDPAAMRVLARAMRNFRASITDIPAWRRFQRAKGPIPAAAVVELLAVLIQRHAYWPVKFCAWRETGAETLPAATGPLHAEGRAVYEISSEGPGRQAAKAAVALADALIGGATHRQVHDLYLEQFALFLKATLRETPAADALHLARAGQERGIPWSVVNRSLYLRMGSGRNAHMLYGTESTNTTSIARALSRDKVVANALLTKVGVPAANQRSARTEEDAISHANELGFPLVIKPLDGNMGRGVTIGVSSDAEVARAFARARKHSRDVVLETLIEGDEIRLLVVNGKLAAAVRRHPAQVHGDGSATVAQLVEIANRQPEREMLLTGRMAVMKPIQMDDEALELLAEQDLTPDAVPPKGQIVLLRRESNISRGGHPEDVTALIHPSIRRVAERAAEVVGLDVCGVDFITTDLSKHWRETGGAICEVNSRPGINMHLYIAGEEKAAKITDAFLDMLFPKDRPARVPVVALLGEPEETQTLRLQIEAAAMRANKPLAVITAAGLRNTLLSGSRFTRDATALNWDNTAEAAVVEITPRQLVREGLGFDRVDLAVLPTGAASARDAMAVGALHHVAGHRIIRFGDDGALPGALKALGLPEAGLADLAALQPRASTAAAPVKHRDNPDEFTALFVGDIGFGESYMHHPRVAGLQQLLSTHGHGYSMAALSPLLQGADLTVGNLEVPLAGRPDIALQGRKNYLGWSDATRTVAALQDAGIDAVTLANNHALDCGTTGLAETLMRLQDASITSFGAGRDGESAGLPFIHRFTVGGVERSLVVFAGFEHRPRYENRYRWYADHGFAGVAKINPARIARSIAALRPVLPNPIFIAYPHWGTDYEPITETQRETAAALVAGGIDLIIGHGAHIVQPAEMIDGVPVIFNIGNFVWNTPGRFNKRDVPPFGTAVSLVFRRGQRGGPAIRLHPLMIDNAVTNFQNRLVTPEEFPVAAKAILGSLSRPKRVQGELPYLEVKLPLRHPSPSTKARKVAAKPAKTQARTNGHAAQTDLRLGG